MNADIKSGQKEQKKDDDVEAEAEMTSLRETRGYLYNAAKGYWITGNGPEGKVLLIDEMTTQHIERSQKMLKREMDYRVALLKTEKAKEDLRSVSQDKIDEMEAVLLARKNNGLE